MGLSPVSYSLQGFIEQQRYVAIASGLTARVGNPLSGNSSTTILTSTCDANHEDGGTTVPKGAPYQMQILGGDDRKSLHVKDDIEPPIEINHRRESLMDKCQYNFDLEVRSDGHQTGATLPSNVGDNGLSSFLVAALGRGPPAVHDSPGLGTTAPTPARILFSAGGAPRNGPNPLAGETTPAHVSCADSLLNSIPNNQGHAATSPPRVGRYHCATQGRTDGQTRLRIGYRGDIPRWVKGSTISYSIREESFKHPYLARFTEAMVAEATGMWRGVGVKFKQVPSNCPATFQIKYLDLPSDDDTTTYAESFFPQDRRGEMFVYKVALEEVNLPYLANILAHELGHILGLRHTFAGDVVCTKTGETREEGSVLWGRRNESSVMNYFADLKLYSVQEQDVEELRSFYDFTGKMYKGLMIRDFTPGRFRYAGSASTVAMSFFHSSLEGLDAE
ncbi:hypothetical protein F4803DRAFT_525038 [Xylaria telfairii]|nr:hypothetical protein F4803DRAFT_525038 [Xylaria telfairii]